MSQQTTETTALEPVRKTVTVEAPIDHAFTVFTERMDDWWPIKTHSVKEELAEHARLEPRVGGKILEVWRAGTEIWGEIIVWDPPHRLVFTWHPGLELEESTEVEVRFMARGDVTVVELEHRGWEARGDRAAEVRTSYEIGWIETLNLFARAAAR